MSDAVTSSFFPWGDAHFRAMVAQWRAGLPRMVAQVEGFLRAKGCTSADVLGYLLVAEAGRVSQAARLAGACLLTPEVTRLNFQEMLTELEALTNPSEKIIAAAHNSLGLVHGFVEQLYRGRVERPRECALVLMEMAERTPGLSDEVKHARSLLP